MLLGAAIMPTCDVCGEENIGVAYHCTQCLYDECEACHAALAKSSRDPPPPPQTASATVSVRVAPRTQAGDSAPSVGAATGTTKPGSTACLPLLLITIGTLAVLTVADLVGLVRITESIYRHEPHRLEEGSIAGSAAVARQPDAPYYEATPDRVWQTTGLKPGTSRRASECGVGVGVVRSAVVHPAPLPCKVLYLVSNSTKERKRAPEDYPPDSQVRGSRRHFAGKPTVVTWAGSLCRVQGVKGPDGYYVQHLYWSLKHAEENFLPFAGRPDVLLLYAEDVDGPAVARAASKLTKSAVVAQPINFRRTAPGYENATTAFTTCWEGNDWVRRQGCVGISESEAIPQAAAPFPLPPASSL